MFGPLYLSVFFLLSTTIPPSYIISDLTILTSKPIGLHFLFQVILSRNGIFYKLDMELDDDDDDDEEDSSATPSSTTRTITTAAATTTCQSSRHRPRATADCAHLSLSPPHALPVYKRRKERDTINTFSRGFFGLNSHCSSSSSSSHIWLLYRSLLSLLLVLIFFSTASAVAKYSTTFNYTGSVQNFTVPVGYSFVTIYAYGAQGGKCTYCYSGTEVGGLGGMVEATVSVTPGQVLFINVGGMGFSGTSDAGGYNGGGSGENPGKRMIRRVEEREGTYLHDIHITT